MQQKAPNLMIKFKDLDTKQQRQQQQNGIATELEEHTQKTDCKWSCLAAWVIVTHIFCSFGIIHSFISFSSPARGLTNQQRGSQTCNQESDSRPSPSAANNNHFIFWPHLFQLFCCFFSFLFFFVHCCWFRGVGLLLFWHNNQQRTPNLRNKSPFWWQIWMFCSRKTGISSIANLHHHYTTTLFVCSCFISFCNKNEIFLYSFYVSEKQRRIQDLAIAAHKCERLENILMETETKKVHTHTTHNTTHVSLNSSKHIFQILSYLNGGTPNLLFSFLPSSWILIPHLCLCWFVRVCVCVCVCVCGLCWVQKRLIELERAYEQKMAKMDEVEEEVGQLEHHIEDLRNQTKLPAGGGEEREATMNRTSSSSKTRELLVLFIKCVLLFLFVAFTAEWLVRRHEVLRDYLLPSSTGPFRPTWGVECPHVSQYSNIIYI